MNFLTTQLDQSYTYNGVIIRVAGTKDDPLFCAKDVCLVLGLDNSRRATARLKPEELYVTESNTNKGKRELTFVNESGLYRLIFTSLKPEAEAFRTWVFSEVLPSIRKTGGYGNRVEQEQLRTLQLSNSEKELSIAQTRLNLMKDSVDFLDSINCLDDRARAMMQSTTLNLHSTGGGTQEVNACENEWSISRRVSYLFNCTLCTKKDKALLCELGKRMSQLYRAHHGTAPPKRAQFVDGTTREVNHYTLTDFEAFGDNMLRDAYNRAC